MKHRLMYIELKAGFADNGPAWIGYASFSKTGATIYFNGQAFRSLKGSGIGANYFDIETGDEYWISGIKKNGEDRHWAGGGTVMIDRAAVKSYLSEVGKTKYPAHFEICDLLPAEQTTDHNFLEHQNLDEGADFEFPRGRSDIIKRK